MEIAGDDDGGHHRHTRKPEMEQKPVQVQLHGHLGHGVGFLFDGVGGDGTGLGGVLRRQLPVGFVVGCLVAVLVDGFIHLPHGLGNIHLPGDGSGTKITGENLEGEQQPQQHHRPQGVGKNLGCFLQKLTDTDHKSNDYGGRQVDIHQIWEVVN